MSAKSTVLLVIAACTLLAACSSSGSSATGSSTGSSAKSQASGISSQCKDIRAKYPKIPKSWRVAVSPFNGNLEEVDKNDPSKIVGVEPDMLQEIGSCLGAKYTYASQPFGSVITSLTSGTADVGITGLFITPARVKVIDMVSHMSSVDELYTTPANLPKLSTPMDMCGHTIGSTVGTAEATYIDSISAKCAAAGKAKINEPHFQDIATLFANVVNGRLDGTINSTALAPQLLQQYSGKLVEGFHVPGTEYTIGIGVSKKTESVQLPQAITDALAQVQKNGDYVKILQKWGFPASAQVAASLHTA